MDWVIVHKYVEPDLNNLKVSKNADCCNCLMSEKTKFSDGSDGYLCKASLYDIKTLACFVPKQATEAIAIRDCELEWLKQPAEGE